MGFAIAMNVGVICSRARWSRAETYTFIVLASNCPLPGVFFLQSSFQIPSNFFSIPKILARSVPAFVDGEN